MHRSSSTNNNSNHNNQRISEADIPLTRSESIANYTYQNQQRMSDVDIHSYDNLYGQLNGILGMLKDIIIQENVERQRFVSSVAQTNSNSNSRGLLTGVAQLLWHTTIYSLVSGIATFVSWECLHAYGLRGAGMHFCLLMMGVFYFAMHACIPLSWLSRWIIKAHTLSKGKKEKIHRRLFSTTKFEHKQYTNAEKNYFQYEVDADKARKLIYMIRTEELPRYETLDNTSTHLPDELAAQVWIVRILQDSGKDQTERVLHYQYAVRAAFYDLICDDSKARDDIFKACSNPQIRLEIVFKIKNMILKWLEKDVNAKRLGFNRFEKTTFYEYSSKINSISYCAMMISIYTILNRLRQVGIHVEQIAKIDQVKCPRNQEEKQEAFRDMALEHIKHEDWMQRKYLSPELSQKTLGPISNTLFILSAIGNALITMGLAAGPSQMISGIFPQASEFIITIMFGLAGFSASWCYGREVAKKQIAAAGFFWDLYLKEKFGYTRMLRDAWGLSFWCYWKKAWALTMAGITTWISLYQIRSYSQLGGSTMLPKILRYLFTHVVPWAESIYMPIIAGAIWFVNIFYFFRMARFIELKYLSPLPSRFSIRETMIAVKDAWKKPMTAAVYVVSFLQTLVFEHSLPSIEYMISLRAVYLLSIFTIMFTINRKALKSLFNSLHVISSILGKHTKQDVKISLSSSAIFPGEKIVRAASCINFDQRLNTPARDKDQNDTFISTPLSMGGGYGHWDGGGSPDKLERTTYNTSGQVTTYNPQGQEGVY